MTTRLRKATQDLERLGVSPRLIAQMTDHVLTAAPPGLVKIPPFRLARDWGVDRYETLEAFLFATRHGVFDMEWDIRCPSCTGSTQRVDSLSLLKPQSHCGHCNIDITGTLDEAVEVTFRVSQEARRYPDVSLPEIIRYWISYERLATAVAAPGETVLSVELGEGRHHLMRTDLGFGSPLLVEGESGDGTRALTFTTDGTCMRRESCERLAPGRFDLRIVNTSSEPLEVMLLRVADSPWVTGLDVTSNQSFRDFFTSELIAADESFAIRNLVFAFTDIKGSTALYERLGDSLAYGLVREHFRILTRIVRDHHGAVVKTIGDAIMATFVTSEDAAAALLAMHGVFDDLNRNSEHGSEILIKVGAHRGACIAVTSNDALDYFGRTVNLASRVQGLSAGRDVMMTRQLYDDPGVGAAIARAGWLAKGFTAALRGIPEVREVLQVTPE
ncbi:MAG: adenylate/guanylate cyclase domain-containing protein [Candidatus Schekmanbacteria bacterium]|nr:adenylate/guanylate cyclase domain-containing protein [Candidatus Schekmanbacteria bacterium]